ncbi:YHYH protein [Paraglaciecola hydrolytica]|uniref:YHYH domain-containing protein n=1 Tax=Paraglaciecola hydrolytica TaxID=1799789 RepID=A0A136A4X8_9ALTE|nr:YHYH protein [Paraglaciecola hydrolytica]KXI30277.1 hypothetical protein AX660_09855 [Paraglaciecola hydrolytica]
MLKLLNCYPLIVSSMLACVLSACGSGSDSAIEDASPTTTTSSFFDPEFFIADALLEDISTQSCTLSNGTVSTCYKVVIAGKPANREVGPFCPPSITSDASEGGIWFDGSGEVYDIDGDFILKLDSLYGSGWQLYNVETGLVNITNTQAACEAAARPNVDPAYQNYCVQCSLDYVRGGISQTFLIPTSPVVLNNPANINSDLGVSLDGVVFAPAAPVNAILANYTIAAFDDCGGHINPFEGYHYHASTGCTELSSQIDGHASLLGFALDGYGIFAMLDASGFEETDLDECRGHSDEIRGYHYHSASAGENMFIGCFHGAQGSISETQ